MDKLPLLRGADTQELLLILSEHVKHQKVKTQYRWTSFN